MTKKKKKVDLVVPTAVGKCWDRLGKEKKWFLRKTGFNWKPKAVYLSLWGMLGLEGGRALAALPYIYIY
jgi:hypothetical protein